MASTDQTFQYTDPKGLDGSAYEVVDAAFKQAQAVGELYQDALADCFIYARNAEMERECNEGGNPNGAGFVNTPLGVKIGAIKLVLKEVEGALEAARKAAVYNPRKPPTEEKPL